MNKKELINAIFNETGMTKREIEIILTRVLETIMTTVSEGDKVQLVGFGSFSCSKRLTIINSNSLDENQPMRTRSVIKFSAGKFFKEKVNVY